MKSPSPIFLKRKVSHTSEVSEETLHRPQMTDMFTRCSKACPNGAKRHPPSVKDQVFPLAIKFYLMKILKTLDLWLEYFMNVLKEKPTSIPRVHEFRLEYWSNCHRKKTTLLFTYIKLYKYGFGQKWGMPLFWGSIGGKWAINHQPFGLFPPCLADHLMLSLSDRKNMEKLWKKVVNMKIKVTNEIFGANFEMSPTWKLLLP